MLAACAQDSATSPTPVATVGPSVANSNAVVALVAEAPVSYDATKNGAVFTLPATGTVTYNIAIDGTGTGLSATGGRITGTPAAPGVITASITATDAQGRSATDKFSIVVFAPGLLTPSLPSSSFRYTDAANPLPAHFTSTANGTSVASTDNTPANNAITDAGATLGRVLFYDPRLSANDALSCGSCHVQSLGFSGPAALSIGFAGALTGRHSPGLTNARFYKRGKFFWDERAATLEAQTLGPIQSAVEMGMTLDGLVTKLAATPYYPTLFTAAFGTPTITSDRIANALAQFTRSMVSAGSRYDRAFGANGVANFASTMTAEEVNGEALFRSSGCADCHTTTSQVSDSVHNIGLDATLPDTGSGRGAFKAPSLRNIAVHPRFMHDGRYGTLDEVVAFLDTGVKASAGLDARLKDANGLPRRLNLGATKRAALVAFLKTLTDSTFLTAERWSNPFSATTTVPPVTSTNTSVTIQFTAYHPNIVTVTQGSTITFTNLDNTRHSATFSSPLITGTPIFNSGSMVVSVNAPPGSYHFQCAVHGANMSGTVIVK